MHSIQNPSAGDGTDPVPVCGSRTLTRDLSLQFMEVASIRAGKHYVPDRIMRCTGTASALDPWPPSEDVGDGEK